MSVFTWPSDCWSTPSDCPISSRILPLFTAKSLKCFGMSAIMVLFCSSNPVTKVQISAASLFVESNSVPSSARKAVNCASMLCVSSTYVFSTSTLWARWVLISTSVVTRMSS